MHGHVVPHSWDQAKTPRENLQAILRLEFPSPVSSEKEEFSMECGICYAEELASALPDRICDNTKCARAFHTQCLYEWLKALPTSRSSFNTVFGTCPYCTEALTVTYT